MNLAVVLNLLISFAALVLLYVKNRKIIKGRGALLLSFLQSAGIYWGLTVMYAGGMSAFIFMLLILLFYPLTLFLTYWFTSKIKSKKEHASREAK